MALEGPPLLLVQLVSMISGMVSEAIIRLSCCSSWPATGCLNSMWIPVLFSSSSDMGSSFILLMVALYLLSRGHQ